jgi:hypothetical protein
LSIHYFLRNKIMSQLPLQLITRSILLSAAIFTVSAAQPVVAASACKGLDETACAANTECRWQAGYSRKDGSQVAAHCRASAKKKEPVAAPPAAAPSAPVATPAPAAASTPAAKTTP